MIMVQHSSQNYILQFAAHCKNDMDLAVTAVL